MYKISHGALPFMAGVLLLSHTTQAGADALLRPAAAYPAAAYPAAAYPAAAYVPQAMVPVTVQPATTILQPAPVVQYAVTWGGAWSMFRPPIVVYPPLAPTIIHQPPVVALQQVQFIGDPGSRSAILIGSYRSPQTAAKIAAKLSQSGFPFYQKEAKIKDKVFTRLYAGPFASRSEAEEAARKLSAILGKMKDGVDLAEAVVPYKPD